MSESPSESQRPHYSNLFKQNGPYTDEHYELWLRCELYHLRLKATDPLWTTGANGEHVLVSDLRFHHLAAQPGQPYHIFCGWYELVGTRANPRDAEEYGEAFEIAPEQLETWSPQALTAFLVQRRNRHVGEPSCRLRECADVPPEPLPAPSDYLECC